MLNIFNNGSQLWVLLLLMLGWGAYWGYRTYKSHKSGYHKQLPNGKYVDTPPSLLHNTNFWFLVAGEVLMAVFLFWINSDYK